MSTAQGERRLRLADTRNALYQLPMNELFELPGRPHVVYQLRSYADAPGADDNATDEAALQARADAPFLFKAFETGQVGPKRLSRLHSGKPRMATIHEYLDWTVTAQAAHADDELDFGGFRVLVILPRYRCFWPAPDTDPACMEGPPPRGQLGAPRKALPFLQTHGKPMTAATIRSGPGYLEVPFVATHESKRGRGYCRCLVEAIEDISRALGLQKIMLCSTNDVNVKSTWRHLGFDFTSEEQMAEWDILHTDLVYLQNTTQMHKDVPPPRRHKPVVIKQAGFAQRSYAAAGHKRSAAAMMANGGSGVAAEEPADGGPCRAARAGSAKATTSASGGRATPKATVSAGHTSAACTPPPPVAGDGPPAAAAAAAGQGGSGGGAPANGLCNGLGAGNGLASSTSPPPAAGAGPHADGLASGAGGGTPAASILPSACASCHLASRPGPGAEPCSEAQAPEGCCASPMAGPAGADGPSHTHARLSPRDRGSPAAAAAGAAIAGAAAAACSSAQDTCGRPLPPPPDPPAEPSPGVAAAGVAGINGARGEAAPAHPPGANGDSVLHHRPCASEDAAAGSAEQPPAPPEAQGQGQQQHPQEQALPEGRGASIAGGAPAADPQRNSDCIPPAGVALDAG